MVYAKLGMCPRKWDTQNCLDFEMHKSLNISQTSRSSDCQKISK